MISRIVPQQARAPSSAAGVKNRTEHDTTIEVIARTDTKHGSFFVGKSIKKQY